MILSAPAIAGIVIGAIIWLVSEISHALNPQPQKIRRHHGR